MDCPVFHMCSQCYQSCCDCAKHCKDLTMYKGIKKNADKLNFMFLEMSRRDRCLHE